MAYVIIRARQFGALQKRDLVPDRKGGPLTFERRRTAEAYVSFKLRDAVCVREPGETERPRYRVSSESWLPDYIKHQLAKEAA